MLRIDIDMIAGLHNTGSVMTVNKKQTDGLGLRFVAHSEQHEIAVGEGVEQIRTRLVAEGESLEMVMDWAKTESAAAEWGTVIHVTDTESDERLYSYSNGGEMQHG